MSAKLVMQWVKSISFVDSHFADAVDHPEFWTRKISVEMEDGTTAELMLYAQDPGALVIGGGE